jgi:hypothetical protein
MKTIQRYFKREQQEDIILTDNSVLLKVTLAVFSMIFVVCLMHQVNII